MEKGGVFKSENLLVRDASLGQLLGQILGDLVGSKPARVDLFNRVNGCQEAQESVCKGQSAKATFLSRLALAECYGYLLVSSASAPVR